MNKLHRIIGWALVLHSAWCLLSGIGTTLATSGQVVGSDFGMLITIAHLLGLMLVWLALFGAWRWTAPNAGAGAGGPAGAET